MTVRFKAELQPRKTIQLITLHSHARWQWHFTKEKAGREKLQLIIQIRKQMNG